MRIEKLHNREGEMQSWMIIFNIFARLIAEKHHEVRKIVLQNYYQKRFVVISRLVDEKFCCLQTRTCCGESRMLVCDKLRCRCVEMEGINDDLRIFVKRLISRSLCDCNVILKLKLSNKFHEQFSLEFFSEIEIVTRSTQRTLSIETSLRSFAKLRCEAINFVFILPFSHRYS